MFGCSEVLFVGYLVNKDGILPLPEKIELIANYKQPDTVRNLRKFLAHLSQDADLALMTDASDFGLGASLNEITRDGFKPLGFFSKKLTPAQTKYSAFDHELLAAYSTIKYFRHMIEGRILILYTDHKPLTFAFNQKLDKASPRQLHHLDFILQFTTDIRYVPGIDVPADAFSRISAFVTPSTIDYEEFAQMQQGGDELKALLSATNQTLQLKRLRMLGSTTEIYCDISTGTVRPYVPHALRQNVFLAVHNLSHPGIHATTKLISKRFLWTSMNKDIHSWTHSCIPCQS
ncbi:transposon Tf2-9 polyprotein [Trichonephila clavipes]|nr:transposon Tf2-9 polyprotein [Trichonephila clavipes]